MSHQPIQSYGIIGDLPRFDYPPSLRRFSTNPAWSPD
jgi:hypothetical protein